MIRAGPFLLTDLLGRGGMGEVWRGRHRDSGQPVAAKLIPGVDSAELLHETRALARMNHPHIVPLYDLVETDTGQPALVMALAEGGGLHTVPRWRWRWLGEVAQQALAALAHAHARGVLHLDIKPANLLLRAPLDRAPPHLLLADFGIARLQRDASPSLLGTLPYLAPERHQGDAVPGSDLYALGCTVWRLLLGHHVLWSPDRPADSLALRAVSTPPPLPSSPHLPTGLSGWLQRMMMPEPADRFPSAAHARRALRALSPPELDGEIQLGAADAEPTGTATITTPRPRPSPLRTTRLEGFLPIPADWREPRRLPDPREMAAGTGLWGMREPPLVGREAERDALWGALRAVIGSGRPRAVVISGPPGIGRSRLVSWLLERVGELGVASAERGFDGSARPAVWVADGVGDSGALLAALRGLPPQPILAVAVLDAPVPAALLSLPGLLHLSLRPLSEGELGGMLRDELWLSGALSARVLSEAGGDPAAAHSMVVDWLRRGLLVGGVDGRLEAMVAPEAAGTVDIGALLDAASKLNGRSRSYQALTLLDTAAAGLSVLPEDDPRQGRAMMLEAQALRRLGHLSESEAMQQQILAHRPLPTWRRTRRLANLGLWGVSWQRGAHMDALRHAQAALALCLPTDPPRQHVRCALLVATSLEQLDQLEAAAEVLSAHAVSYERILASETLLRASEDLPMAPLERVDPAGAIAYFTALRDLHVREGSDDGVISSEAELARLRFCCHGAAPELAAPLQRAGELYEGLGAGRAGGYWLVLGALQVCLGQEAEGAVTLDRISREVVAGGTGAWGFCADTWRLALALPHDRVGALAWLAALEAADCPKWSPSIVTTGGLALALERAPADLRERIAALASRAAEHTGSQR